MTKKPIRTILGIAISVFFATALLVKIFENDELEIKIIAQNLQESWLGTPSLTFKVQNHGPAKQYNYYVKVGDDLISALASFKYCEGTFFIAENEEKIVENSCTGLKKEFLRYRLFLEGI